MFPFNPNIPYIKKNGKRTTLGKLLGLLPDITDELDTLDGRLDDAEDAIETLDGRLDDAEESIDKLEDEKTVFDNSTGTASTTNVIQDITGYKYADIYLRCAPSTSVEENMYCVTIPIQIDTPFNIVLAGKTSIMYMFMYKFKFATSTSFTVESSYRVALTDGTIYDTTNQVALHKIVVHN